MEQHWWVLFALITLIVLQIANSILFDNLIKPYIVTNIEGFEDGSVDTKAITEENGMVRYLDNKELYDAFYSNIYDQLTQGSVRTQAEVGLMLSEWAKKGDKVSDFVVLDGGCGTGIAACALAKGGVKRVVGMDNSESMLKHAKDVTLPATTLTNEQKKIIEWRFGDLINPSACQGGEFTHALMLYFTIYYFPDKETVFRNLFYWVKPGGKLVLHAVNKHKFDPMLESAAPWLGFSMQKYSETRMKKSEVVFNKFKYTGEFDLQDPIAEFRESFHFKDGKVRRQKHTFKMEDISEIVKLAKIAGWDYEGYTDLVTIGMEYMYQLYFKHP